MRQSTSCRRSRSRATSTTRSRGPSSSAELATAPDYRRAARRALGTTAGTTSDANPARSPSRRALAGWRDPDSNRARIARMGPCASLASPASPRTDSWDAWDDKSGTTAGTTRPFVVIRGCARNTAGMTQVANTFVAGADLRNDLVLRVLQGDRRVPCPCLLEGAQAPDRGRPGPTSRASRTCSAGSRTCRRSTGCSGGRRRTPSMPRSTT